MNFELNVWQWILVTILTFFLVRLALYVFTCVIVRAVYETRHNWLLSKFKEGHGKDPERHECNGKDEE